MAVSRRNSFALLIAAALAASLGLFLLVGDDRAEGARQAAERGPATPDRPAGPAVPPTGPTTPAAQPDGAPGAGERGTPRPGGATTAGEPTAPSSIELTEADIRAAIARGEPGAEVLASRLPAEPPVPIAPRWQPGDRWLVETWYRQVQAPEAPWSGPALWRFEVVREVTFHDVPCHELVVTRADEAGVAPMTLWVSRAGRLVGAETTVTQQGKEQRSLYVADDGAEPTPAPLRAPPGSAPVRLPPLGALAAVRPVGLPFDRLAADRDLPPDLPAASELVGAGAPTLDIEFTDPHDGTTVRQRWSPDDLRWPVVSRTETTLSIRRG